MIDTAPVIMAVVWAPSSDFGLPVTDAVSFGVSATKMPAQNQQQLGPTAVGPDTICIFASCRLNATLYKQACMPVKD